MGQILSNPVIDKEHHTGEDQLTGFGLCAMQGWRMSMEDAHVVQLNIAGKNVKDHIAFYSIFDGHGGASVAQFCGEKIGSILQKQPTFDKGQLGQSLIDTYLTADEDLLKDPVLRNDYSGCTATSILVSQEQQLVVCANAGDSRTVLSTDGRAKALSYDHKPTLASERSRIVAAKGFVEMDRVNGNLALSRAIGDFEFKSNQELPPQEQIVTAFPDIMEHKLNYDKDEFVILACDGIWDCLSSQECVDLVHYGINQKKYSLNDISSRIIDVCCSPTTEGTGIGCDNMSITIVALLKPGENLGKWFERIRSKKHQTPVSFESKRRSIFTYYQFPKEDANVFEVTTKRPQDRFTQESVQDLGEDNMEIDDESNEVKRQAASSSGESGGNGPVDLFSLEALLGAGGIQISQGPNNVSYIHGSALSDMLSSLSNAAAGEMVPEDEEDESNNDKGARNEDSKDKKDDESGGKKIEEVKE
ncbi:hypothetical protein ZYGR_0E01330 [Zygosaccharomyces rouxii]|uniref:protein-serine/threonine phosphatase n=2 Tax=Zygosaccharomyces rouxii TaxID=4956 RepID=C5DQT9_ZYGRC|nr:uncharacterized protein ZYRO0B02948g [Zygosaccharomyces rouxii]KAH9200301.1 phosphatase 2C-domain-containing protein [Zygosaccharomyces rouxii]GAV47118.1 hypothetical protein ZYGR_0E01330 [Zygosaccharomyces rouxii]CAR26150.1 ZYRO0B02948p [Zygosaccharomyces rouxii]